jgi:hypothetical protein
MNRHNNNIINAQDTSEWIYLKIPHRSSDFYSSSFLLAS